MMAHKGQCIDHEMLPVEEKGEQVRHGKIKIAIKHSTARCPV